MTRWVCLALSVLLVGVGLSGLATPLGDRLEALPPELVELIAARRPQALPLAEVQERFVDFLYPYEGGTEPDTWKHVGQRGIGRPVSRADARHDVAVLFDMLKYGYAGYQLFGGDEAFSQARAGLEEALAGETEPIPAWKVRDLVISALSFVQDGHFRAGARRLPIRRPLYLSTRAFLLEYAAGRWRLRRTADGEVLGWLVQVDGQQVDGFVMPTVEPGGQVTYRLGTRSAARWKDLELLVETDEGQRVEVARVYYEQPALLSRDLPHGFHTVSGIPVAVNRGMWTDYDSRENQRLINKAPGLRACDCLIVDLRQNYGGRLQFALEWVTAYTGLRVSDYHFGLFASLITDTALARSLHQSLEPWARWLARLPRPFTERSLSQVRDLPTSLSLGEWVAAVAAAIEATGLARFSGGVEGLFEAMRTSYPLGGKSGWHVLAFAGTPKLVSPGVLVVLVDGATASAGEWFVQMLRSMDNVIVVGQPTAGVLTVSGGPSFALPHSGIEISFGRLLLLSPDLVFREGRGIEPDLWADPFTALDAAIAFLKLHFGCGD